MENMSGYYLDMIEQMGFTIDREENKATVFNGDKKIGTIKLKKPRFAFSEKGRDGRRIVIDDMDHGEFINNSNGFLIKMDTKSEASALTNILRLDIISLKSNNVVRVEFDLIPPSISTTVKGGKLFEISVWVSKPDEDIIAQEFFFRLFPKYGEVYVNKCYQDGERHIIPRGECTIENISNKIVDYVNSTDVARDSIIQDGLKVSLPVIGKCINHLLDFFRGFINDDLIDPIYFKGFSNDDQKDKGDK